MTGIVCSTVDKRSLQPPARPADAPAIKYEVFPETDADMYWEECFHSAKTVRQEKPLYIFDHKRKSRVSIGSVPAEEATELLAFILRANQLQGLTCEPGQVELFIATLAIGHLLSNGLITQRQAAVLAAMLAIIRFEHFDVNVLPDNLIPPLRAASMDLSQLYVECVHSVRACLALAHPTPRRSHAWLSC